jgi:hypothetical protein
MTRTRLILILTAGLLLLGILVVAPAALANGPVVVVNGVHDLDDLNPGDGMCDTSPLPGNQCSLRAAIQELNARGAGPSPYRIHFAIPGNGPHAIFPGTELPEIVVPVVIDGTTQPGSTCPTETGPAYLKIVLNGSNAPFGTRGLTFGFGSDGSTLRGLVIADFGWHGIEVFSDGNIVRCNHVGIGVDGVSDRGNWNYGIFVLGDGNRIGGQLSPAQRNVVADGYIGVFLSGDNNILRGNFIGTTADGMAAAGNSQGVYISGNNNEVGGTAAGAGNLVSGNSIGIRINSGADNTILGNRVGVAMDGSAPLPNSLDGIEILNDATGNRVGGPGPGEANRIAHNGGNGLILLQDYGDIPVRNEIRGNLIYDNGGLGIDLGDDGADTNDPGDGDIRENERQNYPVLAANPGSFIVSGTLDSHPRTEYSIDVYRSDSCDPSGYGEGQEYLTTWLAATGGTGQAYFALDLAGMVADGDAVTATATDPDGNTSEFSNCATISVP